MHQHSVHPTRELSAFLQLAAEIQTIASRKGIVGKLKKRALQPSVVTRTFSHLSAGINLCSLSPTFGQGTTVQRLVLDIPAAGEV